MRNSHCECELGWIGVDLDGTLAEYHDPCRANEIGAPIPAMVDRVKAWLSEGREVRVFTARASNNIPPGVEGTVEDAVTAIHRFCIEQFGIPLVVTCEKDYRMIELWDDRCVQVRFNEGTPIGDYFDEIKERKLKDRDEEPI